MAYNRLVRFELFSSSIFESDLFDINLESNLIGSAENLLESTGVYVTTLHLNNNPIKVISDLKTPDKSRTKVTLKEGILRILNMRN